MNMFRDRKRRKPEIFAKKEKKRNQRRHPKFAVDNISKFCRCSKNKKQIEP